MSEPWEIMKMALCEAGRPDLADGITAPDLTEHPGAIFLRPGRWRGSLDAESWATIHKAASLVRPSPLCVACYTAMARQGDTYMVDPCGHV